MNWESEPVGAETDGLTSPHFDDETTLVTAKKVVPLDEIASKARVKSRFVQGFSLAMVGALGILVVVGLYSYFGPEESITQRDLSAQASGESMSQKADGGTLQSAVADSEANATDSIPQKVSKPAVHTSEKVRVKSKSAVTTQPPVSVSFDAQPEPDDWQTRREMRRDARRVERQVMRERRRRDLHDGIFRINDIFEGRNRP